MKRNIFLFYLALLYPSDSVAVVCAKNSEKRTEISSILHRYVQNTPPFSLCFGRSFEKMLAGRKALLIYFSALTCPQCAVFHGRVLDRLIERTRTKPLCLVIRDYPIDGLSICGSACLWSTDMDTENRRSLFSTLFQTQKQWVVKKKDAALEEIEKKVITYGKVTQQKALDALKKAHTDTSETSIMQSLFTEHNTDQGLFNILGVPFAVLVIHNSNGSYSMNTFCGTDMDRAILEEIDCCLK